MGLLSFEIADCGKIYICAKQHARSTYARAKNGGTQKKDNYYRMVRPPSNRTIKEPIKKQKMRQLTWGKTCEGKKSSGDEGGKPASLRSGVVNNGGRGTFYCPQGKKNLGEEAGKTPNAWSRVKRAPRSGKN